MAKLTVLGIGNLLMRDDGVGVRLLEAVRNARAWLTDVEFIDGGAGGLNLLGVIEDARRLVVFDAAAMGLAPGEFRILHPDQVRSETTGRMSLHDCPFLETLDLTARFFRAPETTLFAIQVALVERGRDLSPALTAALPALISPAWDLVEKILAEN
ncbi:MAG: hydrogenase maturation protease [Planctomycetota bacterium]|nr:hydrogenase maturation protease [Planctomycetota bacterium]